MNLLRTSNATYYHPIFNRFPDRGLSRLEDSKGWYTICERDGFPEVYSEDGSLISSGVSLGEAIKKVKAHYVRMVFGVIFPPSMEYEVWERGINYDGGLYNLVDEPQRRESLDTIMGPAKEEKVEEKVAHDIDGLYFAKKDLENALEFILRECDPRIGEACRKALKANGNFVMEPKEKPLPKVAIRCETSTERGGVKICGVTYLDVIRVEAEDDGTVVAVTDFWPVDCQVRFNTGHPTPQKPEPQKPEPVKPAPDHAPTVPDPAQSVGVDPYYKLKIAKAEGKSIHWKTSSGKWIQTNNPTWSYPPSTYGVWMNGSIVPANYLK